VFRLALALAFALAAPGLGAVQAPPPYPQQTASQLQQLVAPIALYPDPLVAQVLAAATFPEQVVEADRWMQEHPGLSGDPLAQAVAQEPWDPSVKALTACPALLGSMDKNLSWTSSLGDAYFNQQQAVMDAVQAMRRQAEAAGTLRSTPQEAVTAQDGSVAIEPADPDVVDVPAYDPWAVYGPPIEPWPAWYPCAGIWFDGPSLVFSISFPIAFFAPYPWGWHGWRCDWHNRQVMFNRERYVSRSRTFFNRSALHQRAGAPRPPGAGPAPGASGRAQGYRHPVAPVRPFEGDARAARGYAEPQGRREAEPGAFGGYQRGGQERAFSERGSSSMGGGGAHGSGTPGGEAHRGGTPGGGAHGNTVRRP
jgi:hypothetical protein